MAKMRESGVGAGADLREGNGHECPARHSCGGSISRRTPPCRIYAGSMVEDATQRLVAHRHPNHGPRHLYS